MTRGTRGSRKYKSKRLPRVLPRAHRGDIMSSEKRSALMSRIRGRDTGPERMVAAALIEQGLRFEVHARDLPGRPDFLFRDAGLALFIDGDFWHGWRFPAWRHKLSEKWEAKIDGNRRRDARNFRRLRAGGWKVIRLWEHQIEQDLDACLAKVTGLLSRARRGLKTRPGHAKRPGAHQQTC